MASRVTGSLSDDARRGFGDAFFHAADDAMIGASADGRIISWNRSAERMFGYPATFAIGKQLDIIIPEAMRGEHGAGMRRLAEGGAPRLIGKAVEVPARRIDGSQFTIELRISMWQGAAGPVFGAVIRDVSQRRKAHDQLHSLAHFDQLTMLPNRNLFLERLQTALGPVGKRDSCTVIVVDLDRFGDVNDSIGHTRGDDLLRRVALTLKRAVKTSDGDAETVQSTIARIGPNQFGVILPRESDPLGAVAAADVLLSAVRELAAQEQTTVLTASIGVTVAPEHGATVAKLVSNADFALRRAKLDGGDRRQLFLPAQRRAALARRDLDGELRRALNTGEFEVFYQPQVRLSDRSIIGAEALLRWRHPERGITTPANFIQALSDARFSVDVGDWVLETACRQAIEWRTRFGRPFRIGVNLFERQLMRGDMPARVEAILRDTGLPPEDLEIEITENVMTGSDDSHVRRVRRLRDLGIGVSFDDYGTGYASLSLLKRYPITRLKIDRSFVRDLSSDEDDAAIVDLILTLGERFGLEVIAEGVETEEHAARLVALGCVQGQGYLFGRPMQAHSLEAILKAAARRETNGALVA